MPFLRPLSLCLLMVVALSVRAQAPAFQHHSWDVYLQRSVTPNGADRLTFIDILTGATVTTEVNGERYTLFGKNVLYFDYLNERVMTVGTDGVPRTHPFVQMTQGARRVDWVVSRDGRMIAWTTTYGEANALTTITQIANHDGANRREILRDGAREGIRALPVAFSVEGDALFMDAHPDGLGRFVAYPQYAGLFRVDFDTSQITPLPGEPSCFCGAGFRAGQFLRLSLSSTLNGFDLRVYNLDNGQSSTIPSLSLAGYTQAGDILIAPDGTKAVYALSQVSDFGTPRQSVRTVFVLADLRAYTQAPLTDPITTYVQPTRWTEDNAAVLFTSPQVNGTWKITLADGKLKKVAEAALLGRLDDTTLR